MERAMKRHFVSIYTDGPATRWNVIDRQTQEWIRRFATKDEAEQYAASLSQKWEVGKNGWDATDEATREDI